MRNALILGSGRSGTSMLAGCLHGAGYFLGSNLMPPNEQNPKGYYESFDVEAINEDLLDQVCPRRPFGRFGRFLLPSRPRRPQRWLAWVPLDVQFDVGEQLRRRMVDQLATTPFCFKDPRFCYTLPAWRDLLADPLHLVVFREPGRTMASILRTVAEEPYLRDLKIGADQVLAVWCAQYRHILERHARQGDWLFVHYDQILDGSAAERLEGALGAPLDLSFPEPSLKRSPDVAAVSEEARGVYAALCRRAGYRSDVAEP